MNTFDDPTPTQRIWQPVADSYAAHLQAFTDLREAMRNGNVDAASEAQARIDQIETESRVAHAAARKYVLEKIHPPTS